MSGERYNSTFAYVAAVGAGAVSLGLGIIAVTLLGVVSLSSNQPPGSNPAAYLLVTGTLAGILAAGVMAWWLLEPIESAYRRGGLAMVFGFATVLLMLICMPVHEFFGRPGLVVLLTISGLAAALFGRRARHLGSGR